MFNLFFNIKMQSKKYCLINKCRVAINTAVSHQKQTGQIGIIVILIMMVMLTVGLSLASRSVKEVDISSEGEQATRAFNTAEGGVEQALSKIYEYEQTGDSWDESPDTELLKYNIDKQNTFETKIFQGYSAKLPLENQSNLVILWSKIDCDHDPLPAAILVSIFSDRSGLIVSQHYAVDACAARSSNNFAGTTAGAGDYEFRYVVGNLDVGQTPLFARITPVYNDAEIRVVDLPSTVQYDILARGRGSSETLETKAIAVDRTIPAAPAFMNFGIVSGGTISK